MGYDASRGRVIFAPEGAKSRKFQALSPVVTDPQTRLIDALNLMRSRSIHHLVVMEKDQVVGLIEDRHIFQSTLTTNNIALNPLLTVKDLMLHLPECLDVSADLHTTLGAMRRYNTTAMPLTENGKLVALVTERDLLRVLEDWASQASKPHSVAEEVRSETEVLMANPLVQNIMHLLGQAGI